MNCSPRFWRLGLLFAILITLFVPAVGSAQTWQAGFDFRATSSYVTDPANTTYVTADPYPTTRGGFTFGWLSTAGMLTRNRSTSLDPRLAGVEASPNNAPPLTFEIDVPAPGDYNISLAMGDGGSAQFDSTIQFLDGSAPLFSVSAATIIANTFVDATGVARSAAQWPGSNVARTVTLTGTKLMVTVGSNLGRAEYTPVAFIGVAQSSGVQQPPDFGISASPTAATVVQGMAGASTITTTGINGFNSDVSLSASGAPAGVTVSFNPATIVAPGSGSSSATFTVSSSATPGTYPITITGTGGGDTHTASVNLTVTASADFSISGTAATSAQGSSGTSTITTTALNGFNAAVALSATGAPSGVTVDFNPTSIAAPGGGSSTATFTVGLSAATGTYPITITGTSGSTIHSTAVNLTVTAAPDFTMSANPGTVSVAQGGSNSSTINTAALNGFSADVALSATGAPAGVTVGLNPSTIAAPGSGSSAVTFTVDPSTATGTYPVTITGMGGGSTHATTVTLTVTPPPDFTISASDLTVAQGGAGPATVTTTVLNAFNSSITLSSSGAPAGVTVSFNPASIAAPGSGSSTATFTIDAATATGTYPVTITGTSGSTSHSDVMMLTVTDQTAFVAGFDFRASGGYVTDPANTTYVAGDHYPTTRGGFTFGWQNTSNLLARDRSKSIDPRLAGMEAIPNNIAPTTFEIDVPTPGTYQIALAMGDAGSAQFDSAIQFLDGTTPLFSVSAATINGNAFVDATGVARTAAQWPASNVIRQVTLSGTKLMVAVGSNIGRSEYTPVAYIGVTQVLGNPPAPDFSIAAAPTAVSVAQGMAGTSTISTTPLNGFNAAVSLSASGAPGGVTVGFNPASIAAPGSGSSTATFTVAASTAPGTYPITITGTGLAMAHTATVNLTVTPAPDFSISGTAASAAQGASGPSTITTSALNGFNAAIGLSATGAPTGVTVGFNPTSIAAPGSGSSTATFTVSASVGTGIYPVTITGTSGGTVHSTLVNLTVTPAADFSISGTAATAAQGSTGTSTITTATLNGFNSAIALSTSGAPTGVTVGFNPSSIALPGSGSSTATFTVGSSVAPGMYAITITGVGGGVTHTTSVSLTVTATADFSISASPNAVSAAQGGSNSSTVTTTALSGFNADVSLSASGAPAGVTVAFNPTSIVAPGSGSSTVSFTVDPSAATGTYPIIIMGVGGGMTHAITVNLTVTPAPDFSIAANPTTLSVGQGNSGNSTVTTAALNGFNAVVTLSASGAPAGVTVGFNPATIAAPGSGSSMVTFTVDSSTATGTYPITISGSGGGNAHTTTVTLTVTPPPDFTIAGGDATAAQGTMGTSMVTTTILNGFNSAVTLSSSGAPAGVTVSFNPASITAPGAGTSTATFAVTVPAATGTYPITITGTAGGTMHSTTVNLTVTNAVSSTFQAGFDFRASAGYVTDPAITTYVAGDRYPTTRSTFTFGWQSNSGLLTRDRSKSVDPRLAGMEAVLNNVAPMTFEIDVPAPGAYNVALAMGDAGSAQYDGKIQFLDGSTPLFTVTAATIAANTFVDATGIALPASQWPTSNTMKQVTLNGTKLMVVVGSNIGRAEYTPVAYLGVSAAAPRTLNSVTVAPQNETLILGNLQQFTATANYSDGSTQDVTSSAQWNSSDSTVLSLTAAGLATAQTAGTATVTAAYNAVPGTSNVTVPQATSGPGWTSLGSNTALLNSGACPQNFFGGDGFAFASNCSKVISSWNGAVADTYNDRLIIWGGGHDNYYGNEIYSLNLTANPVTLTRLKDPTVPTNYSNNVNCVESLTAADGTLAPNDRESYGADTYIAHAHRMFVGAGSLSCQSGGWGTGWWTIPLDGVNNSTDWTYQTPTLNGTPVSTSQDGGQGFGNIADYDPVSKLVFYSDGGSLYTFNYDTNTSQRITATFGFATSDYLFGRVDPNNRLFVALGCIDATCSYAGTGVYVADVHNVDPTTGVATIVTSSQNWTSATMADSTCAEFLRGGANPIGTVYGGYPGLVYDPVAHDFVGWPNEGNSVYILTPDVANHRFTCQKQTFPNGPPNSEHSGQTPNTTFGTYGRFSYFPDLDAFVLVNDSRSPAYILHLR